MRGGFLRGLAPVERCLKAVDPLAEVWCLRGFATLYLQGPVVRKPNSNKDSMGLHTFLFGNLGLPQWLESLAFFARTEEQISLKYGASVA